MDEMHDPVNAALRTIAREDAANAPAEISSQLTAAFRAQHSRRAAPSRAVGLAMAATLVAALASSLWIAVRWHPPSPPLLASTPVAEITTEFMPLAFSAVPYTNAHLVRLQVPRTALATFGLLSIDATVAAQEGTVTADVLVGEDGLARAVRFVRAPRAPGVLP